MYPREGLTMASGGVFTIPQVEIIPVDPADLRRAVPLVIVMRNFLRLGHSWRSAPVLEAFASTRDGDFADRQEVLEAAVVRLVLYLEGAEGYPPPLATLSILIEGDLESGRDPALLAAIGSVPCRYAFAGRAPDTPLAAAIRPPHAIAFIRGVRAALGRDEPEVPPGPEDFRDIDPRSRLQ